ncbi:hypothetical protein BCV69DRAFT_276208 [Microstroma glucosiphilum]|uniref:Uncharacterized protein n=1 Tax=Pseudomicrostroma glucosiphilum TaxID=1684307 RepID=A0A316UCQ8_9BASI|nr:hypothetical protein BCV69DRAFT_276208 [Pseudomicrostroma glucosiphilum]PWN22201.1 hypothetical protein BCV69DRAFT_276208 [Pseudomicrostroma glucosiphilum]
MSRTSSRQAASLPSSPYQSRNGRRSSTSSSDGWWEHVLPEGQLAERLRKAHEPNANSLNVPTSTSRRGRRDISSTPTTPRLQTLPAPRSIVFPSRDIPDVEGSSAGSRASSTVGSVSSMRTNFDKPLKSPRSAKLADTIDTTRKGKTPLRGSEAPRSRPQSLKEPSGITTTDTRRKPLSQVSYQPKPFPSLSLYGSRSPLSSTPEVSSGSEAEDDATSSSYRRRTRSAVSLSAMGAAQTHTSAASSSSHSTQLSFHSSFSRSTGRAASRKVNFELDQAAPLKSEGVASRTPQSSERPTRTGLFAAEGLLNPQFFQALPSRLPADPTSGLPQRRTTEPPTNSNHSAIESLAASGAQHWFNSASSSTMSRRRTRTLSRDGFASQRTATSRRPGSAGEMAHQSPRGSIHLSDGEKDRIKQSLAARRTGGSVPESKAALEYPTPLDLQHLPLSRSLQHAQDSLFRTTTNALGFSRSLLSVPGPLFRPLLHFTLIWCVSGATVMALVGCLMMSYFLTAWDDVAPSRKWAHSQSKGKQRAASEMREGQYDDDSGSSTISSDGLNTGTNTTATTTSGETSPGTNPSSRRSSTTMELTRHALDHLVLHPLTYAASVPIAVAKSFTPSMVESASASSRRASLAAEDAMRHPSSLHRHPSAANEVVSPPLTSPASSNKSAPPPPPPKPKDLPPRPPLSALIPSMLFTILIAVGAGLVGGWAKKYSKPTPRSTPSASAANSGRTTPTTSKAHAAAIPVEDEDSTEREEEADAM